MSELNTLYRLDREIFHPIYTDDYDDIVDYTIYINDTPVYTGTILGNSSTVDVDIATIARSYNAHNPSYDINNTHKYNILGSILKVDIEVYGEKTTYNCIYNYDFLSPGKYEIKMGVINEPIKQVVDPSQDFNISFYNNYPDNDFSVKVYADNRLLKTLTTEPGNMRFLFNYIIPLEEDLTYSDKMIRVVCDSINYEKVFHIKRDNSCNTRYCIHYQNLKGGIDSMLCEGKSVINYSNNDIKVKRQDRLDDHSINTNVLVDRQVTKSWNLNTGILSDAQSELMPHLLLSKFIWIEDLNTGIKYSVELKENNHSIKTFKNDKYVNYELTFEETNKYIIR